MITKGAVGSLSLYFILMMAFSSFAQDLMPVMRHEVTQKNGVTYFKGRAFTGIVFDLDNDVKVLDAHYLNGRLNGRYIERHSNGKLKFEANYNNGKLSDGTYFVYDRAGRKVESKTVDGGVVIVHTNYSSGKKDGVTTHYSGDGTVYRKERFNNGVQDGVTEEYDQMGRVALKQTYMLGDLMQSVRLSYHSNGKVKKRAQCNSLGTQDGIVEEYFETGELFKKTQYENGIAKEVLVENADPSITVGTLYANNEVIFLCDAMNGGKDSTFIMVAFNFGNSRIGGSARTKILSGLDKRLTRIKSTNLSQFRGKAVEYRISFSNPKALSIYDNGKGSALGGFVSTQTNPGYRGKATVYCEIKNLKTGRSEGAKTLEGITKKYNDRNSASSSAISAFSWAVDNMTYGFFKLSGGITTILDQNRRGEPTRVEVNLGNAHSLANGFKFNVYKLQGSTRRDIGYLVLQDVLGDYSSRCKVKKGHREIKELMDNGTPVYVEGNYNF